MVDRISVALCTYNGSGFVADQLESIFNQTRLPDELIIVDDASTDATAEVVARAIAGAPIPVRFDINERNLGVTRNFERALSRCSGEVVFLADQDDVWLPAKVERMARAFDADRAVLLAHSDARVVDANLGDKGQSLFEALKLSDKERAAQGRGRLFDVLLRRNLVTGCTAAVRRELIDRARPFPATWLHDEWLAAIAAATGAVARIDEALLLYRQHAASEVGVARRRGTAELRWLLAGRGNVRVQLPARMKDLADRLGALGQQAPAEYEARARSALEHMKFRAALPSARLRRIGPVWNEWRSGRYRRYSRGMRAVVADLLEPIVPGAGT